MRIRSKLPNNPLNTTAGTIGFEVNQLIDVLDTIKDGVYILDQDFKITYANKAFEKQSSTKAKKAVGKSLWQVFPHVAYRSSLFWTHFHEMMETKKPVSFTYKNFRNDWIEINAYPTKEGGIAVFIRDVTRRIEAENALRESEERFRALLSGTEDSIYLLSPDFSELTRIHGAGYPTNAEGADGNWMQRYIVEEHRERTQKVFEEAIGERKPFALEHKIRTRAGKIIWMYSRATPIFNNKGDIIEWIGASTDITERRKQLENEERIRMMTEQRNALVKINRAKDEFVALASHQLRTPATAVKQYVAMLMNGFAGKVDEKKLRLLKAAYDSNERELKIINDLLQTARIDGSSHNLKAVEYDIIELVENVVDDLMPTLEHRDQKISVKYPEEAVGLKIDVTEIKLAISNLLDNASKYSPRGSTIKLKVNLTPTCVAISVTDKGVGVKEEHMQKIFEKFSRVNNPLSDTVSGSGLGLYWVKLIAEIHKGGIELESKPGKGSTFTFKLPRQKQ